MLRISGKMTTVICVVGDYIRQRAHVVPGHGAQGRYSLGTNVNTPFSSIHARIWGLYGTLSFSTKVDIFSLCAHRLCLFWGSPLLYTHC